MKSAEDNPTISNNYSILVILYQAVSNFKLKSKLLLR